MVINDNRGTPTGGNKLPEEPVGSEEHGGVQPASAIPTTRWTAWYLQVSRRSGRWEPVLRHGHLRATGATPAQADGDDAVGTDGTRLKRGRVVYEQGCGRRHNHRLPKRAK